MPAQERKFVMSYRMILSTALALALVLSFSSGADATGRDEGLDCKETPQSLPHANDAEVSSTPSKSLPS
jgi:hypothetical protein